MTKKFEMEKLIIQLEINRKNLDKQFTALAKDIDKRLTEIEERTKRFEVNVSRAMSKAESSLNRMIKQKKHANA